MEFNLFKNLRKKDAQKKEMETYFRLINGYTPAFTTFEGGVYEQSLTRAAIHTFATHCSKLKPEVIGSGNATLQKHLLFQPNTFMNTQQYLYKLATILETDNTVFILPLTDNKGFVTGYYPVRPQFVEVKENNGNYYYEFTLTNGNITMPIDIVGRMNRFLYKSDFFGAGNNALATTMELLATNNEAAIYGMKNSASIRFLARLASVLKDDDIKKARENLSNENLNAKNNGGVFLYDPQIENVTQVKSEPFVVNAAQQKLIEENVYNYFGCTRDILQNNFKSDDWAAYYEGKIEPFALQASLAHTNMTFSDNAISYGNQIMFTADRLQYLSPEQKRDIVQTLFDRGMITVNRGAEIFNMPGIGPEGDKFFIRKEYIDISEIQNSKGEKENEQKAQEE